MTLDRDRIVRETDRILPDVRCIRQHLHANPELSLKEFDTSRFIRNELEKLEIPLLPPLMTTDVTALLQGPAQGRNVTLRADMDALPIEEDTGLSYCSATPGVMHACGHDGHMAMLLGAAMVLKAMREEITGSVRFVFQPGEEVSCAGKTLVQNGILDNPGPHAVIALHSWPGLPEGMISSKPGPIMAAADFVRIRIKGDGGHGSAPEKSVDTILTSGRVINGLCMLSSRKTSALDPVVVSICSIHGGSRANVIPREVVLEGSVRYLTEKAGRDLPSRFEEVLKAECGYTGADYDLEYVRSYVPTVNSADVVASCRKAVMDMLGKGAWADLEKPVMGSEDFSFYLQKRPGAMFFIGMGEESAQLHTGTFNFNDSALKKGILFLVLSALTTLSS